MSARRVVVVALALFALVGLGRSARAQDLKDRFNFKVSLSGLYVGEQQDDPMKATNEASTTNSLGYADLRIQFDARRLPGKFELHLDGRLRLTEDFDVNKAQAGASQYTARGYYGGREYELRQAFVMRRGDWIDFSMGRFFVLEADGLKLDGLRVAFRFRRHWEAALFAGGYPNPYSRSVTTDYQGANGYNGAAVAGGASIAYTYDRYWGSFAAVGSYLGGQTDGGPVNPMNPSQFASSVEGTRSYLTWQGFERFTSWLDVYHNLVLDLAGSAGVQLTRLDVFATARAGKHVTIRAGYDHLAPLAIEMYLTSLLSSRSDFAMSPTITNNLLVTRTARDQGRLVLDVAFNQLHAFADGRLRYRSLENGFEDPQFLNPMSKDPIAPRLAYDATVGLRDGGSLKGIRAALYYTYLSDYRSQSHILGFELGRSFLEERLTFDLNFLYARTRDAGAGQRGMCGSSLDTTTPTAVLIPACYGTRDGANYETGLTVTGNPWRHWFALLDYRLVINQTDARPLLLTHVLLFRIEARY